MALYANFPVTDNAWAGEEDLLDIIFQLPASDTITLQAQEIIKECTSILTDRAKPTPGIMAKALRHRGLAYLRVRNFDAAEKDFLALCTARPDDGEAHCLRASALRLLRRRPDAMREAEEAIRLQPRDAAGYLILAMGLIEQRDFKNGYALLDKAISVDATNAQAYLARGLALVQQDPLRSLTDLNRFLELSPNYEEFEKPELPYYFRGRALVSLNRPNEALGNFLMARKLNPANMYVASELALVYADIGKLHIAVHYAKEVIRLEPRLPNGHELSAQSYSKLGRNKEALEAIAKLLELSPNDPTSLGSVGEVYLEMENYSEALKYLNQALEISPDHFWSLMGKASLHASCPDAKFRNGKEAVRCATKAFEDGRLPRWGKWKPGMVLAEAHAEAGDFEEAVRLAKDAVELAGPDFGRRDEYLQKLSLFMRKMPYRRPDRTKSGSSN